MIAEIVEQEPTFVLSVAPEMLLWPLDRQQRGKVVLYASVIPE